MYTQIASKLFVAGASTQVSQAVSMEGYNYVRLEFTVFSGSLATFEFEESNDLENWTQLHLDVTGWVGPTYAMPVGSTSQAAFIRVRWTCDSSSVIAGGVNLSSQ